MKSTPNRVLNSEQFENGDEPKKQIKVRRNSSNTGILDDAFAEGLKNSDQVSILANCLDSFKRQVKELFFFSLKSQAKVKFKMN